VDAKALQISSKIYSGASNACHLIICHFDCVSSSQYGELLFPQAALAYWYYTRLDSLKALEQVFQFIDKRGFLFPWDDYVLGFPEKLMKLLGLIVDRLVVFHKPSTLNLQ
jgi:hypothetical protein